MKEYKIIKKNFWSKDGDLENQLNQYAHDGWRVVSAIGEGGYFTRVILERDKNRM